MALGLYGDHRVALRTDEIQRNDCRKDMEAAGRYDGSVVKESLYGSGLLQACSNERCTG